jgi:PRTRC genetic system protein E
MCLKQNDKEERNVFVELMPLLKERTLLITVARVAEKVKVNVIPAKVKEGEDHALTTPLSFTGSAEELDSELGRHLVSYVDSHLALGSTLADAKAEMDAAVKAARQKGKSTQQASKADPAVAKKDEAPRPTAPADDTTPSLFAPQQSAEPTTQAAGDEGEKLHHDRRKSAVSQLYVQRRETSGPGSEDDAGRSENHLQPPISRARHGRNHGARSLWGTTAIQLCESYWDEGVALIAAGFRSANTN